MQSVIPSLIAFWHKYFEFLLVSIPISYLAQQDSLNVKHFEVYWKEFDSVNEDAKTRSFVYENVGFLFDVCIKEVLA